MLNLPPSVRLFVATEPADMRKSFDGLAGIVRNAMEEDPLSGHLFIFFNRQRDRAKILWWDRSGFFLLAKRLEAGKFKLPAAAVPGSGRTHCITSPAGRPPGKRGPGRPPGARGPGRPRAGAAPAPDVSSSLGGIVATIRSLESEVNSLKSALEKIAALAAG